MTENQELERLRAEKLRRYMASQERPSEQSASGKPLDVSSQTFEESVLKSGKPVIVDFWADWCGPCHAMHPIFVRLASAYSGRAVFVRVNVDENAALAARYDVYGIPTFIIFKDGKPVERIVGAVGERPLRNALDKYS